MITFNGFVEYYKGLSNVFPVEFGYGVINGDILIEYMSERLSDFQLIYNDMEIMKAAFINWVYTSDNVWKKLAETVKAEYSVTENYRITEKTEEKNKGSQESNSKSNGVTNTTANNNSTHSVVGFNSNDFTENERTVNGGNGENKNNVNTESKGNFDSNREHTKTEYGNKCIAASELIEKARAAAVFNIYDYITNDFKHRFCIMVY